ncbi:MAG: adenylate/guanylate cyclase domain-containing protein [Nitrospira sp.]|nr:adenylate/guanylate cyclase domain-containing protein [Nitrospira sp.]
MNDPVAAWLQSLGLDRYRELFEQNAITWDVLPELNDGDLASMGIVLGHRKQLLRAIAQLSQSGHVDHASSPAIPTSQEATSSSSSREQAERRQLTVMFCDLVGSTALACRLDPEDLQEFIRRFLDACSQAIGRFNGYIAKYMGDGLLVYFGYPQAQEHDAERAIHAGLAILELARASSRDDPSSRESEIAVRIGIATGHVIVGEIIGQETAKERSVFGETPNLAARLQALAAPNQLIVDSATKRLVGGEFEFANQGTVSLKGFETPVQVWRVLGSKLSASRFESYRAGRLTQFIGREHETALLLGRWREAAEGEGQVVLLCGETGIGKSRIARNLRDRLAEERYRTIQFQCSPYHVNTALYPVINHLRQAAGLTGEDSATTQLQKLDRLALDNGIGDQTTVSLLAELLSIRTDVQHPPLNVSPEKRKQMTLDALVQYVQRSADRCPTLFVVEDAHWIDPTTMDLLTRAIDRIQSMRVLLIITFRPEFKPVWADYSHVTFLTLSRLPRRHSAELLAAMTGGKAFPPEVERAILAKTDGVPLYVEELAQSLFESGLLTEENNSFSLKAPLKDVSIPDSLQGLLMERIDRLGPTKEIVQVGAAIGREFSYELLRGVVDVTESRLQNALQLFVESGLILQENEIPTAKFQFRHMLLQEAAYSTLPKKSRRALHARIAKTVEEKFPERAQLEPELLAYHFEQAGSIHPAITYWHLAARRDAARSANVEALNHFNSALTLLKDLPAGTERDALELDLLIARGAPMVTVKGYASQENERNYLRARELSRENSESDHHFLAVWGLWVFHLVRGPLDQARVLAEELLSLAPHLHNPDLLIRVHESVGSTYFFLGRFDEAKEHLLAAKSLYDPGRHRSHTLPYTQDPGITARIILARTLWILGEVDQVEALLQEAVGMARELEHPFTLAFTLTTVAWTYSTLRDADKTLNLTEEAIALSTKYSFEVPLAWATSFQGWAMVERGNEEGIGRLVDGLAATRAARASLNNTYTLALLADVYLRKQQIEEGLTVIKEAQELAMIQGERCWQAELFRLNGELLLGQSDQSMSEAEQCFTEALRIARDQHATMLELRAAISMARLLKSLNRSDAAKNLLQAVRSRMTQRAADPELIEAETILMELDG